MPIKQVVCSICKQTVNKAVTYHVGGTDRACRSHEGVAEKKIALDAQKQKTQAMSVQKAEHRRPEGDGYGSGHWSGDHQSPKCWVCMNTGLRSQEFFLRYLIEVEKQSKITGKTIIPLFDKTVRMKVRCIFLLTKEQGAPAMKFVRDEFRQLVDIAGFISICGDCCGLCKIQALPDVKWEDLEKIAPVTELVLRPAIEAQAVRELGRDN